MTTKSIEHDHDPGADAAAARVATLETVAAVPSDVVVTSPDLAIVRFHGRNAAAWEAKNITPAERFRYLYSRDELAE